MAIYSTGLMRRLASVSLRGNSTRRSDAFAYDAHYGVGHRFPQSVLDTHELSSWQPSGTKFVAERRTVTAGSDTSHWVVRSSYTPELTYDAFTVLEGRLYLKMAGWWTVAEMEELRGVVPEAAYYLLEWFQRSGDSEPKSYYAQIKLYVASRRHSDADIPDNWVGAAQPDIRVVYDHLQQGNRPVIGEILVDVTDYLCSCPRYREDGDQWRARVVEG